VTQSGFFDLDERHPMLEKLHDPLPKLDRLVKWKGFQHLLARVREKKGKSNAKREPFDIALTFKILVLQYFYNLSKEQIEYQILDRYSFCHFPGLTPESRVSEARIVSFFRKHTRTLQLTDALFAPLMVEHDSRVFQTVLAPHSKSGNVCADIAYQLREREVQLHEPGCRGRIHTKGKRGPALSAREKEVDRKRSLVGRSVERRFGAQPATDGPPVHLRTRKGARMDCHDGFRLQPATLGIIGDNIRCRPMGKVYRPCGTSENTQHKKLHTPAAHPRLLRFFSN